ncbi:MAG: hypothetical protein GPJ54_00345 [Candidatus Heimdallarchaeota archaeon]|nr:hypothetical protein [Candidatus Heimdallarchaeota archaeon]
MSKSSTKKDESKKNKDKKPIEFNMSDGVSWHDFAAIFVMFFVFLWKLVRLILAPLFWVYGENVRMFRFVRASSSERPMTEDERLFVESIPFILSLTGAVGGVLVGVFAAFSLSEDIEDFIDKLSFDFLGGIWDAIGTIIGAVFGALFWVLRSMGSGLGWGFNLLVDAFQQNVFLAFMGLASFGIVLLLIWVALAEKGVFQKLFGFVVRFFRWLVGSPERFRFRMDNYYRKMNHWLSKKLVGEDALLTRTQIYFKRSVTYTLIASFYSFSSGIYIGISESNSSDQLSQDWQIILFIAGVLFVAGILSGTLFFALIARFLDLLNRKKYIAPEFKNDDDSVDEAKMKARKDEDVKERAVAHEEYEKTMAKMAEKPWKKREAEKASKSKTKPKETPKASDKAEE